MSQVAQQDEDIEVDTGIESLLGQSPESDTSANQAGEEHAEEEADPGVLPITGRDKLNSGVRAGRALSPPLSNLPPSGVPRLSEIPQREIARLQQEDKSLRPLFARVGEERTGKVMEAFHVMDNILYRSWRTDDNTGWVDEQLVVPEGYRQELIRLAHEAPLAGHLGVRKTVERLRREFWWPSMSASVANFLKSCHICQLVGKPNQKIPVAPLIPIPAVDPPFTRVLIDMVGPLPPTSGGNKYLLTIMDTTTRYPEAIPVTSMKAKTVLKHLLNFFTRFGLPVELQSDRGANFTSNLFKDTLQELGVKQILSSAYHPQSQGALERFHQTLKSMMRKFCLEHERDWDVAIPFVLFAAREVPSDSLGFSPNELVFGHKVRGPLSVVHDAWVKGNPNQAESLLEYVRKTRERLHNALALARENLCASQYKMKAVYDRKACERSFEVGDEVLVLLPLQGKPLAAKYHGPYKVVERVGQVDYVVETPDRRKLTQFCHVNMLKPYHRPSMSVLGDCAVKATPEGRSVGGRSSNIGVVEGAAAVLLTQGSVCEGTESDLSQSLAVLGAKEEKEGVIDVFAAPAGLWEGKDYAAFREKLKHLDPDLRDKLCARLWQFSSCVADFPDLTFLATDFHKPIGYRR